MNPKTFDPREKSQEFRRSVMIKAAPSYNLEEGMSKTHANHLYRELFGFPEGGGIYFKTQESNLGNSPTTQIMGKEDSFLDRDLNANLTKEEWETALTLNSLEYMIVIRDNRQERKKNHKSPLKVFQSAFKDNGITQKRKRSGSSKSESHRCPNCNTTDSSLWRNCIIRGKSHHFCNACGLRFKKGKFCPICYKVYYDVDTNKRDWKQCSICFNWTHQKCLKKLNKEIQEPYTCNICLQEE